VFLALVFLIEIFFQTNSRFHFLKSKFLIYSNKFYDSSLVKYLDSNYQKSIPKKFRHIINPKLLNYSDVDIEQKNKYPPRYISNFRNSKIIKIVEKIKNTDLEVYNVSYQFDSNGFRIVSNNENKVNAQNFVLAAGDSFTFGEGVEQGEDYPSQLNTKLSKDWNVYNFGFHGFGPNDFYDKSKNLKKNYSQINEKNGVFVWFMLSVQFERIIYPSYCISDNYYDYIKSKSFYQLDKHNNLIKHESFNDFSNYSRLLSKVLSYSETLKYLSISYPSPFSTESFKLFLNLLKKGRDNVLNGKKISKSVIVVYNTFDFYNFEEFRQLAAQDGFEVLVFLGNGFENPRNLTLYPDGHPSKESYWILSEVLKNYINSLKMFK
jgi:hypothetical protein